MTQNVNLEIMTQIMQVEGNESFTQKVTGEFLVKPHASYLRYQEKATAQQASAQVLFKFQADGKISLQRKQADGMSRLLFTLEAPQRGLYQIGKQQLALKVVTTKHDQQIDHKLSKGKLALDYQLFFEEQLLGEYKIRLQFKL